MNIGKAKQKLGTNPRQSSQSSDSLGRRKQIKDKLSTGNEITWCPGCSNFMILESVKNAIAKLILEGKKQEDFAISTGIGCHAKIFDYLNLSGVYSLHGRVLPTCLGMKIGNPNLTVIGFEGDGDVYAEGIAHLVHACRYNADLTLIVHNNQAFSLTTGQSTPTSQQGYKNKAEPLGEFNKPLNPIKLVLASGATFVSRCNAKDLQHTPKVLVEAIKHKGFSFVEMIQPCLQFNKDMNELDKLMYKIDNKNNMRKANDLADKWDYNSNKAKIPVGIFYQSQQKTLEEKWPQISGLLKKKINWKNLKR